MTNSASSPHHSDRRRLCRETDRKSSGGLLERACGQRDLPRLDSSKHQHTHTRSQRAARFKSHTSTKADDGRCGSTCTLPVPVSRPKWDFCTDDNKGFIFCQSAQEERKTHRLGGWFNISSFGLYLQIICIISQRETIQLVTLESIRAPDNITHQIICSRCCHGHEQ